MYDRVIFIGDLHGCYDEATELLNLCQPTPNDWVIFLGDYVDRGPENAKCCDLVRQREQVQGRPAGILGNHEETHVRYDDDLRRLGSLPNNMPPTHVATRQQLRPEHYDWFRSLPTYLRIPEHNAVAVHAGVFPGRRIEDQTKRTLLHVQMIRPYKTSEDGVRRELYLNGERYDRSVWPSRVPENEDGWGFWTNFWTGPEFVVFGHSVFDRPLITDNVAGIDGGACFGMELHAFILPERKVVTVQARSNFGRGHRGSQNDGIKTFTVHGNVKTYS